ncbi:hypothetical protein INT45_009643 [Circinella minor]|uniref:Uncharacterized protein n=1 Tax=Circinella minor TaxID=1195481 RepID=A0A8H7RUU2_9FUNG|nr:hypothetical protein INT45_009643 [Circinella minor]
MLNVSATTTTTTTAAAAAPTTPTTTAATTAAATVQQFSLIDMLALFIYEESSRKELLYHAQYDNQDKENGVYQDVFDGDTYKEMKAEGHFANPLDIALSLYTDVFSLGPNGQLAIMIQTAILLGPKAPRNLFSFLKPLLSELETLQLTGILVKADDQKIYHSRTHLLLATGDLPATTKMALHVGHTAKLGCRVCEVEGSPVTTINKNKKEVKSGMYFIPQRNSPALHTRLTYTKGDPSKGVKKKTRFQKLSSFKSPTFFSLDCMLLICHGIVRQFWKLIIGIYGSGGNPFYLKPTGGISLATIFINKIYIVSTIVIHHFKDQQTKNAIMTLVNTYNIVFSKSITNKDIQRVDTDHYLTHLSLFMRSMGPMSFYSAYVMEHAIGEIKQKIKSRSALSVNAGNVMYKLAAHHYNERIKNQTSNLSMNNDKQILTTSWNNDDDCEIWGLFWMGIISEYARYDFETCLRNYWHIHINDLNDNINLTVEFGSRLWLNERDVTGSSYQNQDGHRRDDFYVKLMINVAINWVL